MRVWKKGKYTAATVALTCVILAGAGSTLAYFTDSETKTNTFTVGDLDVDLREPEWEDGKDGTGMYPGYTVYKNPTVKNITSDKNGEEPCYVRMNVELLDEKNQPVSDEKAAELIAKTMYYDASFTGTFDSADGKAKGLVEGKVPGYSLKDLEKYPSVNPLWVKDEERSTVSRLVYNYVGKDGNGILKIGEESTLFTNVVIPTDWNQTEIKTVGNYQLKVSVQAIQANGFANQSDALKMLDKEAEKGGDTL